MPRIGSAAHYITIAALACLFGCSADSPSGLAPQPVASPFKSSVSTSVSSIPADGVSTATVTVTLRDSNDAIVANSSTAVAVQTTAGSVGATQNHGDGTYTATVTAANSPVAARITATLDGTQLARYTTISFDPLPPATGVWVRSYTWLYADGISSVSLEIYVTDARGNPVLDTTAVSVVTSAGTISNRAGSDGYFSVMLTSSTVSETAIVTARSNGQPIGPPLSIVFDRNRHWASKSNMTAGRMNMGVAAAGGLVYAAGGEGWAEGSRTNNLEMYDPGTDTWTSRAPMLTARTDLGAGVVDGVVYAVGGADTLAVKALEAYNPATNSWSTKAPMLTARSGLGVGVVDGILYAVGGRIPASGEGYLRTPAMSRHTATAGRATHVVMSVAPSSGEVATMEAYDPATNSWHALPPMPTARSHAGVGVLNGILYVVGGATGSSLLANVEAYDPVTRTWASRAPLPRAQSFIGVTSLDGKLYAIGGYLSLNGSPEVQVYDPATDTWTNGPTLIEGRLSAGVVTVNGHIYAVGGACDYTVVSSTEAFTP